MHLVFPRSHHRLELNYYPSGSPFYEPFRAGAEFDHFGFYVSDPHGWLRSVVRAGAKPVVGYVDGPAQLLYVKDPDGVWLAACGPSAPGSLPGLIPSADATAFPRKPRRPKVRAREAGKARRARAKPK